MDTLSCKNAHISPSQACKANEALELVRIGSALIIISDRSSTHWRNSLFVIRATRMTHMINVTHVTLVIHMAHLTQRNLMEPCDLC